MKCITCKKEWRFDVIRMECPPCRKEKKDLIKEIERLKKLALIPLDCYKSDKKCFHVHKQDKEIERLKGELVTERLTNAGLQSVIKSFHIPRGSV